MPSSAPYLNFDLLITRAGDRHRALVVDAPGGDADIFFDLPPSLPDFQALLKFAGPRRGVREEPVESAPVASLDDVGSLLYEAIFQGDVRDVLVDSLALAADNAAGLRLRLRFHEDAADLATLPWEILYDARQERFLALSENLPILRYLSLPRPRPALVTEPPLRVLAVLASPVGLEELDLEGEWQVLVDALAPLVTEGKVVLDRLASPTLAVLQQRLLGDPVHVLHFVGHGIFDEESRQGMLVLADERDQPRLIGAREVAALLANHTSLRLLYLNACEGALGDDANVFAGLAQRLVQQGAPAAIAMQAEISDSASIELARTFYTALATGRPVDAALTQARLTLFMNSSSEWATPVLFSRAPDNRLFDIRAVLPTPDCPYPGMKPFSEDQQKFFFGRDREIDDAVNRLAKHPFLTVIGPSGSGKSSLVYAGILPALRASRHFGPGSWTVHTLRPSDARTPDGKAAPMQALSRLGDLSAQSPIPDPHSPILLFIDQFEEVFTLADAAEARAFLDAVHGLIGQPNLYILLTVRADFYAEMMSMGDLWEVVQVRRLELTPLGEDELWAAIVEPAAHVGVEVEDALATALIADARGEAGVLPLVQETLVRLWDKVKGRQLKRSAYRQMGEGGRSGIQVAINDHANDIYHTLPAADRSIARRIFLRLIQFGEGRADTRRQQTVAELRAGGDDPVRFDETLRALVDGRLLTSSGEEGDPNRRVDISHEALIDGWRQLSAWIHERRTAELLRRRLEESATQYLLLDRQGGFLDARELPDAENWISSPDASELGVTDALRSLLEDSRRSLRKSIAIRYASLTVIIGLIIVALAIFSVSQRRLIIEQNRSATEEAIAAAEIAQKATAEATALVAANTALEVAVQAQSTAEAEQKRAEQQSRIALARQLAAQSKSSAEENATAVLTFLLAAEAVRTTTDHGEAPVTEADRALRSAVESLPIAVVPVPPQITHVLFSMSGHRLAAATGEGEIIEWETTTWMTSTYVNLNHRILALTYLDENLVAATAPQTDTVQLTSISDQRILASLWHSHTVSQVEFSADGTTLATVSDRNTYLWKSDTGIRLGQFEQEDRIYGLIFHPIGQHFATVSLGNGAKYGRVWDLETGALDQSVELFSGVTSFINLRDLRWSANGRYLILSGSIPSGSNPLGGLLVWDLNDNTTSILTGRLVTYFDISPNSTELAYSEPFFEQPSQFNLYDMTTDQVIRTERRQWGGPLKYNPATSQLWMGSSQGLTDVTAQGMSTLSLHQWPSQMIFSADGRFMATLDSLEIWVWQMNAPIRQIRAIAGPYKTIEYRESASLLMAVAEDHRYLWQRQTGSLQTYMLDGPGVWQISMDGRTLYQLTIDPSPVIAGYHVESGELVSTVKLLPGKPLMSGWQSDIQLSPNQQWVMAKLAADYYALLDAETGEQVVAFPGSGAFAFSSDGKELAIGYTDSIEIWNLMDVQQIANWSTARCGSACTLHYHSNHSSNVHLLVHSEEGYEVFDRMGRSLNGERWSRAEGTYGKVFLGSQGKWFVIDRGPSEELWRVGELEPLVEEARIMIDPSERFAAIYTNNATVKLFRLVEPDQWLQPQELPHGSTPIHPFTDPFPFDLNGDRLVTYSERNLYVWDTVTAQQILVIGTQYRPAKVMIGPSGDYVAISDGRNSLDIWRLDSGEHVAKLKIDDIRDFDLDFTGKWIVLRTGRQGDWLMRVDSLDLLRLGCGIVRRGLDVQHWNDHLGQIPFRQTCTMQ
jgi:CHAT domain-containing protein/WD40 repeat protein